MTRVIFREEALTDVLERLRVLRRATTRLGERFRDHLDIAVAAIQSSPELYPVVSSRRPASARRALPVHRPLSPVPRHCRCRRLSCTLSRTPLAGSDEPLATTPANWTLQLSASRSRSALPLAPAAERRYVDMERPCKFSWWVALAFRIFRCSLCSEVNESAAEVGRMSTVDHADIRGSAGAAFMVI